MTSIPEKEPSTPVEGTAVVWLELTPSGGTERPRPSSTDDSHTQTLTSDKWQPTRSTEVPRRDSDGPPLLRSAASEDECGSSASERRRGTLLGSADVRPKHPVLPRSITSGKDRAAPNIHMSGEDTGVDEVAGLVRMRIQQEKRLVQSRARVYGLTVTHHFATRLVRCESTIRHGLLEAYKLGDKHGFATLQHTLHGLRTSCEALRRQALLDPDIDVVDHRSLDEPTLCNPDSTFLHEIPTSTRDELLAFLSVLRSDPNFLVERLASLSATELDSISLPHTAAGVGSVFASPTSSVRKSTSGHSLRGGPGPSPTDRLLSFERHDTFAILFSSLFTASPGSGATEEFHRTEVWSTLLARLMSEPRAGGERLLHRILDAYAGLRGWRLVHNLELFLMGVLRDGHFLVDSPEDHFPRSRISTAGFHDGFVSRGDAFLQTACQGVFKLLSDAAGLPHGVLEVGCAAYARLSGSAHEAALQRLIVHRWFLGRYLPNAILNPEHHGLMRNHHITDSARSSILRPLANEIQKYANDGAYRWQQNVSVSGEARLAIDLLLSSVKPHRQVKARRRTEAMPSTAVLCPADIVTLVNGLFPERRPPSRTFEAQPPILPVAWTSTNFPVSDSSAPVSVSSAFEDASSVFSMGASSMTSDTTSRAPTNPDMRKPTSHSSLRTFSPADTQESHLPDDEYGRRLRIACAEMAECLGPNAVSGTCHPSVEQWAVLQVSTDGKSLRLATQSIVDPSIDEDVRDSLYDAAGFDDDDADAFDGNEELRLTITNLLADDGLIDSLEEEFTKLQAFDDDGGSSEERSEDHELHSNDSSRTTSGLRETKSRTSDKTRATAHRHRESESTIVALIKAAERSCHAKSRFMDAHTYHRCAQQLRALEMSHAGSTSTASQQILHFIKNDACRALKSCGRAFHGVEKQDKWLQQMSVQSEDALRSMCEGFETIRDKMWYTTDVRHSVPYEEARNVVSALKAMGLPWMASANKPSPPRLRRVRLSNNFELRQEGQVLDIIAAPANMAGSNKLSDEQSELIANWLSDLQIPNLCKGEERIHRFCYEINRCADRLIGDSVLAAPVLWSSELFQSDKVVFDRGYDRGDIILTGLGHLSRVGESPLLLQRNAERTSSPGIFSIASNVPHNASHSHVNSLKISPSISTGSPSSNWTQGFHDSQTHLYHRSSSLNLQSSSNARPSSILNAKRGYDKPAFLQVLRQRLLALLLSDFAPGLFNAGCETDAWMFGVLGTALMARREQQRENASDTAAGSEQLSDGAVPSEAINRTEQADAVGASQELLNEPYAYNEAFQQLLSRLSATVDPFAKIDVLYELQEMIIASLITNARKTDSEAIVDVFKRLFSNAQIHQGTLFRDLQYIASFVPSSVIDREPKGPAFWNAVLAAQSLKQDVCLSMIEVADKVVARHTERRAGSQQSPEPSGTTTGPPATMDRPPLTEADDRWAQRLAAFSMAEAAQMLVIAAKEGNPVAQRELAIFYLTHPEILPRALAPLTAPKSVFKPELLTQEDRDKQRRGGQTSERTDPMTLCIAQHWMQCSRNGGDQLAGGYLRDGDEFERIP